MTNSLDRRRLPLYQSRIRGEPPIDLYINLKARECSRPHHRPKLHSVTIKSFASVKDLKDTLQGLTSIPVSRQRLFYRGSELPNSRILHDVGITSNSMINLVVTSLTTGRSWFLGAHGSLLPSRSLQYLIDLTHGGMECGLVPMLTLDGTGGVYFLRDRWKRIVAVYKPRDEEAFTQNNPRGLVSFGNDNVSLRPGIRPGESYLREVAAYLLDHGHKVGLPATTIVESRHPSYSWGIQPSGQEGGKDNKMKVGSFQEYVHHDEIISDIAPEQLEMAQVQLLAVFDIRILNSDRHDANILLKRKKKGGGFELIPIDHGMSFPEVLEIAWCDWCWFSWPQVKEPIDPDVYSYILALNPEKDVAVLSEKLNLRPSCLRLFRVVCTLLIEGAKAGLTLYEIANIILRQEDLHAPSIMERILLRAKDLSLAAMEAGRAIWAPKVESVNDVKSEHLTSPTASGSSFSSAGAIKDKNEDPKTGQNNNVSDLNLILPRGNRNDSEDSAAYGCNTTGKESAMSAEVGFWKEPMSSVDRRNSTRVWDEIDEEESGAAGTSSLQSPPPSGVRGAGATSANSSFSAHEMIITPALWDVTDTELANPKQSSEGLFHVKIPPQIAVMEEKSPEQQHQSLDLDSGQVVPMTAAPDCSSYLPTAMLLTLPSTVALVRSNSFGGFRSFPLSPAMETEPSMNRKDEAFESHFLYFAGQLVKAEISATCRMRHDDIHHG